MNCNKFSYVWTHGSYPYLALAQSLIILLVNWQRDELTEMNGKIELGWRSKI
jgi:hypothetical protein